jgi:cystathionine gamma-synthase
VVAGVLAGAADDEFWKQIVTIRKGQGAILGPFEAYLLMRGYAHAASARRRSSQKRARLAEGLSVHPKIARVLYPACRSIRS